MNTVAKTLGLDTFGKHVEDVRIGEVFRLPKFWNNMISSSCTSLLCNVVLRSFSCRFEAMWGDMLMSLPTFVCTLSLLAANPGKVSFSFTFTLDVLV